MSSVSMVKTIWIVFFILLVITAVEVIFGIIRPAFLINNSILDISILNWMFILLTILKAYYIVWYFMHLKYENKALRNYILIPIYILVIYLILILIMEASSIKL